MFILVYILLAVYVIFKLSTITFNIFFMKNLYHTNVTNRWIDHCKHSIICYWFMFVMVILLSIPFYINIINTCIKAEEIIDENGV